MDIEQTIQILQKAHELALRFDWDEIQAKPDGRMNLLNHTLNAMAIACRLIEAEIYSFSDEEIKLILGALFVHDFSKGDKDIAEMMAEGKLKELPKRLKGREDVRRALEDLGLSENEVERAIDLAVQMEYPNPSDLNEFFMSKPVSRKLDRLLRLADHLAGIGSVDEVRKTTFELAKPLALSCHRVSAVRGITTQLLHRAIQKVAEKKGLLAVTSSADGTVYIGDISLDLSEEEVVEELMNELKEFIDSFDSSTIGSAAFGGRFEYTLIKTPEFIFISKNAAEGFWKYVTSLSAISNPKSEIGSKASKALLDAKPGLSEEEYVHFFRLYNSMRYLLMTGVAVLKEARKIDEKLYLRIKKNLEGYGVDVESLMNANPRHNSPFSDVISCVDGFLEKMGWVRDGEITRRREEIVEETARIFMDATARAVEESGVELPSLTSPLRALVKDIAYPLFQSERADSSYKAYLQGKKKGTPVCPLCGGKSARLGVFPLIGKGAESFSNMLAGGSAIGGENKVRICELCELEAKLRSLVMDSKAETYYIIPQCTIAPNLSDYFWSEAKSKLELGGTGIPSIYDVYGWAELVLNGELKELSSKTYSEVLQLAIENACKDKKLKRAVKKALEKYYGGLEEYVKITGINVDSEEELIKLAFRDKRVVETLGLENVFSRRLGVALSSNYVVSLLEKVEARNDSETAALLRKLFVSLVISKIFSSSVVISEIPLSILHVQTPKGAVKLSVKLGLKEFLEPYMKNGWIPFHKASRLMKKIAALLLLERRVQGLDIYELTKRSPGEILNRVVQNSSKISDKMLKNILKDVLKLLEVFESN